MAAHGFRVLRGGRPLALAVVGTLVAVSVAFGAAGSVDVQVLQNAADRIVVQVNLGAFEQELVKIDGAPYLAIQLPGEPLLLNEGAPELPHVTRSLALPTAGAMQVVIDESASAYYELTDVAIAPSKGNLLRTVNPADVPYTFGPVYQSGTFYPGTLAQLGEPYILRDIRGVVLDLLPFQYNPATRTLRVYTSLTAVVTPVDGAAAEPLPPTRRPLARAFDELYRAHFINYVSPARYAPLDENGSLLIICHDAWIPNVQPLAAHKNAIGIPTTVVGVSTIGNNATAIKSYIQNAYNTGDLAFVLLVGDAAQIATPSAAGGASDPSYALLAGSDNYPDIMVGRFSAETAAQVDTQVLRTINYEQGAHTQTDWFKRGTGIASNQGPGDDGEYDNVHIGNIRTQLLANGYTLVDAIYDPSGTAAQVTAALNNGRGIINYCGHGSDTSWSSTGFSNSHIAALANDNMLPFIFSVACVNGNFPNQTCFAEAWLRATRNGQPTGAIAAYMSSINQSWNPPMEAQDAFNTLLVNGTYVHYGTLCYAGSCSMIDAYGSGGADMYKTWHVFGDPTLRVVGTTAPPTGLKVTPSSGLTASGPVGGPFSPNSMVFTLKNYDPTPITYAVGTTVNWLSLSSTGGQIPASGETTVTVALTNRANFLGDGDYQTSVAFTNLTNHDGDTARDVLLKVGVPTVQYFWNLDTNPGWTTQGQWAWGTPTGGGGQYGSPDPTSGKTGTKVYGYNLNGDYPNNMPEYHLTTTAIDCSNLTQVSLKFWRWLGVETSTYDHAYVRASNNGTTWTTLWQNTAQIADTSWTLMELDLASIADRQPTVYVRWTMGTTDSSWQFCGWNIDDIAIWGKAPGQPPILPGDTNCDGNVNFDDIDPFVVALGGEAAYDAVYPDCVWLSADCNGDGTVNFDDIDAFVGLLGS